MGAAQSKKKQDLEIVTNAAAVVEPTEAAITNTPTSQKKVDSDSFLAAFVPSSPSSPSSPLSPRRRTCFDCLHIVMLPPSTPSPVLCEWCEIDRVSLNKQGFTHHEQYFHGKLDPIMYWQERDRKGDAECVPSAIRESKTGYWSCHSDYAMFLRIQNENKHALLQECELFETRHAPQLPFLHTAREFLISPLLSGDPTEKHSLIIIPSNILLYTTSPPPEAGCRSSAAPKFYIPTCVVNMIRAEMTDRMIFPENARGGIQNLFLRPNLLRLHSFAISTSQPVEKNESELISSQILDRANFLEWRSPRLLGAKDAREMRMFSGSAKEWIRETDEWIKANALSSETWDTRPELVPVYVAKALVRCDQLMNKGRKLWAASASNPKIGLSQCLDELCRWNTELETMFGPVYSAMCQKWMENYEAKHVPYRPIPILTIAKSMAFTLDTCYLLANASERRHVAPEIIHGMRGDKKEFVLKDVPRDPSDPCGLMPDAVSVLLHADSDIQIKVLFVACPDDPGFGEAGRRYRWKLKSYYMSAVQE